MNCPSCQNAFTFLDLDIPVLACSSCRAIWLKQGQLEQIDWNNPRLYAFVENPKAEERKGLCCQACDLPLHYNKFPTAPQVKLARCYGCAGVFLLDFQIVEIRDNSMNPQQQQAYLEQLAREVPGFLEQELLLQNNPGPQGFAKKWQTIRAKFFKR